MYDRNPIDFHQNPYQVLIDHWFYINFTLIFDQLLSKINMILNRIVLFR